MLVVLSQKIDVESSYDDTLFNIYHFPSRYKNQVHKGDIFIYCQGDRFNRGHRYYFGIGKIGEIISVDGENFYAKLLDCKKFEHNVPIYLPDNGYIEQLDYEKVRKKPTPPWQSSIRPISQKAYDYILNNAGNLYDVSDFEQSNVENLNEKLKQYVREYYVEKNISAIQKIESISTAISRACAKEGSFMHNEDKVTYQSSVSANDRVVGLIEYCKDMRMTYSYKPLLMCVFIHYANERGELRLEDAVKQFRKYYNSRRKNDLIVEKKRCIYLKNEITDADIANNIISNPIQALVKSGYFFYNVDNKCLSLSPEVWKLINRKVKSTITKICNQRLKEYYND